VRNNTFIQDALKWQQRLLEWKKKKYSKQHNIFNIDNNNTFFLRTKSAYYNDF